MNITFTQKLKLVIILIKLKNNIFSTSKIFKIVLIKNINYKSSTIKDLIKKILN